MNPVCPGFISHHVKPNRCRRCFRYIHDHNTNNDVSTSFTVPLPRRRRESVAAAETPKVDEPTNESSTASFTITESSSLGRRTRQRSSSTSSWFQEKKQNEDQKEKIDALFRNAEDSGVSYQKGEESEDSNHTVRHRWRATEDDDKPRGQFRTKDRPEDDNSVKGSETSVPKYHERTKGSTLASKISDKSNSVVESKTSSPFVKDGLKTETKSGFSRPSEVKLRSTKLATSKMDDASESPPKIPPKTLDARLNLIKTTDNKARESKFIDSKISSSKAPELASTDSKFSDSKSSRFGESKVTDSKFGGFKAAESKPLDTKLNEAKPFESKYGEKKPVESKFSEIRARAAKFDVKSEVSNLKPLESRFGEKKTPQPLDIKPKDVKLETKVPDKPVLARFQTFKKEEPKVVESKPVVSKPKVPSSSSSSSEETESESEETNPPASTKVQIVAAKEVVGKGLPQLKGRSTEPEVTSPDVAFVVKVKPTFGAQKDQTKPLLQQQQQEAKIGELQKSVESLKKDLKKSEDTCSRLEREKLDLQKKKQQLLDKDKEALEKTASELSKMRMKLGEMQSGQDQVKEENKKLKQEMKETKQELRETKQELKEAKQEVKEAKLEVNRSKEQAPDKSKQSTEQLRQKLHQTETLCQELMEENEDIKKEVRDLEQELEELHDNFREDQASEFRGLKKELETAAKNCRVLQFKLRKAEKRCEQMELDRHALEDKVREYQAAVRGDVDRSRAKALEQEVSQQRELNLSLAEEVEALKEALSRSRTPQMGGTRSATPTSQSRLSPSLLSKDLVGEKDYEALSHELQDTLERESDLREQLRFSEEEAKAARRKTSTLEQENETLLLQMKKLAAHATTTRKKTFKEGGKGVEEAEGENEKELSAEELKVQLELVEQELSVLRRKLDDTERDNEGLQTEVRQLQDKLINQPLLQLPSEPPPEEIGEGGVAAYWERKCRVLELETREGRKRLAEKEREVDRLEAEAALHRKKASRMSLMARSRSLDSDLRVDPKRQLQLVEQEASMLRQKVVSLEGENEKLGGENRRMQLRLSKKPPMTSSEILQLDNLELSQKNQELQKRLESAKEDLDKGNTPDNSVYQDSNEPKSGVLSDAERELIGALRQRLRTTEEAQEVLRQRSLQLEVEGARGARELRRLKEALAAKKRPLKAVRESATRSELRDIVTELQDEISELHVSLRGREVLQEGMEEELEKNKKELGHNSEELRRKEEKLQEELEKGKAEKEALRKEADAQKLRATKAEDQLNQASTLQKAEGSEDQEQKLRELRVELQEAERRTRAAEEALERKTQRLREAQEKLNVTSALKEDMAKANRTLEGHRTDLEKELVEQRSLVTKAEARLTDLRNQMDHTDRDLTSLRKECNQLRNELEDERGRQRASAEGRRGEVAWAKEREDLRRANNELRNKSENLQQQINQNERIWIEKESRLREEHKRRQEGALREARERTDAALELAKEEEKILRQRMQELADKLDKAESALKTSQTESRQAQAAQRREREDWSAQKEAFEAQARSETKRRERAEREAEQAQRSMEQEQVVSRETKLTLEREQRRAGHQAEEVKALEDKARLLEMEADRARAECDELTAKYEQLEEDFVRTKQRLVQDKEQTEEILLSLKADYSQIQAELNSVKDSYGTRQNAWIKEKLDLQERLKESEVLSGRLQTTEQERRRLQDLVQDKETLVESYRKEEKHLKEERERLRKRVEDLSKSAESQRVERQPSWRNPLFPPDSTGETKSRNLAELERVREEYEGRMTLMTAEIGSMQAQIGTLAGERDKLKAQLSSVERTAEEMRTGSLKRERARHREEADLARRKVKEQRGQLEEVREQLEDSLLENRNLRLQAETEKNGFEIQLAESKSKINQLEEQKMLESTRGQSRQMARTRLELAWEKERHELQHLLAESNKLLSDLRTRLETADTNREKEKQALRRQLTEMRNAAEKEHQDNRRKMTELHSSLLEIRESHAKLRGMYERMKKEREIMLAEREEWRQRLNLAQQLHAKITEITKEVEAVSSMTNESKEFQDSLQKLKDSLAELQKSSAQLKDDERLKRTTSFRRAVSAQEVNRPADPSERWMNPQRVSNFPVAPPSMILRPPPRGMKALNRKSLSLDHNLGAAHARSTDSLKIWESGGESGVSTPAGSLLSIPYGYESDSSAPDSEYRYGGSLQDHKRRYQLQTSSALNTDSEAPSSREGSIASAESVPIHHQQKTSTLKDKLKLLRRTKSIEVGPMSGKDGGFKSATLGKDAKDAKEQSLRSKISRVLKKPLGRSFSMDSRKQGPALPPKGVVPDVVPKRPTAEKPLSSSRTELSSTQRPLSRQKGSSDQGRETPV